MPDPPPTQPRADEVTLWRRWIEDAPPSDWHGGEPPTDHSPDVIETCEFVPLSQLEGMEAERDEARAEKCRTQQSHERADERSN